MTSATATSAATGTKVKTPNLDRLATEGMRFTDAHAQASVCTPTRYSLMTGQYAWRHPQGASILSGVAPLSIPLETLTLPKLLKQAGYTTGIVGKWHLGLGAWPPTTTGRSHPGRARSDSTIRSSSRPPATVCPASMSKTGGWSATTPTDPIQLSYGTPVGAEPTGADHPELLKVKPSQGHNNTIINGVSRIGYMTGGKAALEG